MAAVYSVSFFAGSLEAGFSGSLYTVPAGYTAVIRCITVKCESASSAGIELGILGVCQFVHFTTDSVDSPGPWEGRVVLGPGETISAVTNSEIYDVTVNGYLLSA